MVSNLDWNIVARIANGKMPTWSWATVLSKSCNSMYHPPYSKRDYSHAEIYIKYYIVVMLSCGIYSKICTMDDVWRIFCGLNLDIIAQSLQWRNLLYSNTQLDRESLTNNAWVICLLVTQYSIGSRKSVLQQPLATYVEWWVAHAPGMPGTFCPPPTSNQTVSKRSRHVGTTN